MSRLRRLLSLLVIALAAAGCGAADFSRDGPCTIEQLKFGPQIMEKPASKPPCVGTQCVLKERTVTLPQRGDQPAGCPVGPHPVVFFFGGFSTISIYYKAYARKLASYGYAVVQYDVAPATIIPDSKELPFMQQVLDALRAGGALAGRADFDRLAVAGHSRGGKLAALQLASGNPHIKTGFLIDPVDNTVFSPESPLYPNAAKALAAARPRVTAGVVGATIISLCNPPTANYPRFWDQLGGGSWLMTLDATHLAFADVGPAQALPVCGKGGLPSQQVTALTSTALTAWMEHAMRGQDAAPFQAWAAASTRDGSVQTFEVKA